MRIAIVNDTRLAVEALRRVIATVPDYHLVWTARDGAEAVARCAADLPDLILMDMVMPLMDGVEATRQIMASSPCAILMVTATVNSHSSMVFQAMGHGALDVVRTPILGRQNGLEGGAALLAKIATIGKLIGQTTSGARRTSMAPRSRLPIGRPAVPLIAIGSSTGGPQALATILAQLPADLNAGIVIVQHIDVQFATGLAQWLNSQSTLPVQAITPGMKLESGKVLLAATNQHLVLRPDLTLAYTPNPTDLPYQPSVDVCFLSLAQHWPSQGVGVLLTGMGRDGGEGLLALKSAGWYTIAQDRDSCVVYGMPKAAVEKGGATVSLNLSAIAPALIRQISLRRSIF